MYRSDDALLPTPRSVRALLTGARFQTLSALIVYAAVSLLFFGMPIIGRLSETYIGGGTDPICHIWAIAWWPYAITHGLNPLLTHALWAPAGYNLVWGTDIPGPSLVIYPITRIFGPVVSYNLLCLIAPAANGVTAFLLCRYACGRFWPALLGGYVFGFSPYLVCHMLGHLVLLLVSMIPLAVYVVLRRIDGHMGRWVFVGGLIAILLFQFLSSTEIFATATVFGGIALLLGFVVSAELRTNLLTVTKEIAGAYAAVLMLLVPYLYYVFAPGLPTPPNSATVYSNDLVSFALPPRVLFFGSHLLGLRVYHFIGSQTWWEQSGYLGPGLYLLMALFAWSYWRTRVGKFLALNFILITIMSFGPVLHIRGKPLVIMPWRLFNALPLMDEALPGRFGMYLYLIAAVAAAIYLAQTPNSASLRILLAGLSLLFIVPDLSIWRQVGRIPPWLGTPGLTEIHLPDFFRSGQYKRYLARGDNVLTLPFVVGGSNLGMLWQAQADFFFNTTDWFGAVAPPDSARWPIMMAFHNGIRILDFREQLEGFLGAHQIKAIILDSRAPGHWPDLLSEIGMTAVRTGGIFFYKVPAPVIAFFQGVTAHQMAQKYAAALFAGVVTVASRYLDGGYPLAELTVSKVQKLKLLNLPESRIAPRGDLIWGRNLWVGSRGGLVCIAIAGNYEDLQSLVDTYRPVAVDTFFPFPKPLSDRRKHGNGILLFTFTPQGVRRAADETKDQTGAYDNEGSLQP